MKNVTNHTEGWMRGIGYHLTEISRLKTCRQIREADLHMCMKFHTTKKYVRQNGVLLLSGNSRWKFIMYSLFMYSFFMSGSHLAPYFDLHVYITKQSLLITLSCVTFYYFLRYAIFVQGCNKTSEVFTCWPWIFHFFW